MCVFVLANNLIFMFVGSRFLPEDIFKNVTDREEAMKTKNSKSTIILNLHNQR